MVRKWHDGPHSRIHSAVLHRRRRRSSIPAPALSLAPGTITHGLKHLSPLFEAVYRRLIGQVLTANLWQADETRWSVFVPLEGKKGHRWQMWVLRTDDVVVYFLEPSRSAEVIKRILGSVPGGILVVDRYVAYKCLAEACPIVLAFCWFHARNDFVRAAIAFPELEAWCDSWVTQIGKMFEINDRRVAALGDDVKFAACQAELEKHVLEIAERRDRELAGELTTRQRKVLESLGRHWKGLTVFLEHPEVPPTNNASEQAMRFVALARKVFYGSGSIWSGKLASYLFSIFQTLIACNINPRTWLLEFLWACAAAGGVPADLDPFLPWTMDAETRERMGRPPTPRVENTS